MKKLGILLLFCAQLMIGCEKKVELNEVFKEITFNKRVFPADGGSVITVKVSLPNVTSADRKSVVFLTSAGTFTVSGSDKQTVNAEFEDGKLVATAKLRAPFKAGTITVSAQPAFDSPIREYVISDTVHAFLSVPNSIKLKTSSFGLAANGLTQVMLTAILANADDNKVSEGFSVLFEDFLASGHGAGGRFQSSNGLTVDSSKVTSVYGAVNLPGGTLMKIRVTHLDKVGERTSIKDSVWLSINQ